MSKKQQEDRKRPRDDSEETASSESQISLAPKSPERQSEPNTTVHEVGGVTPNRFNPFGNVVGDDVLVRPGAVMIPRMQHVRELMSQSLSQQQVPPAAGDSPPLLPQPNPSPHNSQASSLAPSSKKSQSPRE